MKPNSKSSRRSATVESDSFNSETSAGLCGPSQEGLISKTKVMQGALSVARDLKFDIEIPLQLSSLLIGLSWCGLRLGRWPNAGDSRALGTLVLDFEKAVGNYGRSRVLEAVDKISEYLGDKWDSRIIQDKLKSLREEERKENESKFSNSPLFKRFKEKYPHIDDQTLDTYYIQSDKNFVSASILALRRAFPKTPPEEYSKLPEWGRRWQQYLPKYLKLWQEDLKKMQTETLSDQRKWAESIS